MATIFFICAKIRSDTLKREISENEYTNKYTIRRVIFVDGRASTIFVYSLTLALYNGIDEFEYIVDDNEYMRKVPFGFMVQRKGLPLWSVIRKDLKIVRVGFHVEKKIKIKFI